MSISFSSSLLWAESLVFYLGNPASATERFAHEQRKDIISQLTWDDTGESQGQEQTLAGQPSMQTSFQADRDPQTIARLMGQVQLDLRDLELVDPGSAGRCCPGRTRHILEVRSPWETQRMGGEATFNDGLTL